MRTFRFGKNFKQCRMKVIVYSSGEALCWLSGHTKLTVNSC